MSMAFGLVFIWTELMQSCFDNTDSFCITGLDFELQSFFPTYLCSRSVCSCFAGTFLRISCFYIMRLQIYLHLKTSFLLTHCYVPFRRIFDFLRWKLFVYEIECWQLTVKPGVDLSCVFKNIYSCLNCALTSCAKIWWFQRNYAEKRKLRTTLSHSVVIIWLCKELFTFQRVCLFNKWTRYAFFYF